MIGIGGAIGHAIEGLFANPIVGTGARLLDWPVCASCGEELHGARPTERLARA
jgi:hypothetical protein